MLAIAGQGVACEERPSPLLQRELQAQREAYERSQGSAALETGARDDAALREGAARMTTDQRGAAKRSRTEPRGTDVGDDTDAANPNDAKRDDNRAKNAKDAKDATSSGPGAKKVDVTAEPEANAVPDIDVSSVGGPVAPSARPLPPEPRVVEPPLPPPSVESRPGTSPGQAIDVPGRMNDAPGRGIPSTPPGLTGRLAKIAPGEMCVTRGALAESRVEAPTFRAVAKATGGEAASMRFVVHGDSEKARALASGQKRRQLGLKLRAGDGCNLVYVMWRLDPKPKLEVSVKANPGERTAKECGAGGYTKVKPTRAGGSLPTLTDGAEHELRAEIRGDELTAWIDGALAWQGRLPAAARDLAGPVGVRSDNLAFELRSFDGDETSATRAVDAKCVAEHSD